MVEFKRCGADEIDELCLFSRETFRVAFGPMNAPETVDAYLDRTYDRDALSRELANPQSRFYFLYADGELAGYVKLNEAGAQTELCDPDSLELERIYVAATHQRLGFGTMLMERALEIAREMGKAYLWLGVWEKNEGAIRFYERNGFYRIGAHSFFLGSEEQTDFLMRKDL